MPAAAVIPAPIAYIKVVVVKKLVVGINLCAVVSLWVVTTAQGYNTSLRSVSFIVCLVRVDRLL